LEYEGFETLNHAIIPTVGNFRISIGEPVFDAIRGDLIISSVPFSYICFFYFSIYLVFNKILLRKDSYLPCTATALTPCMYKHLQKRSSTHCDVIPPLAISNIKPTKARERAGRLGRSLARHLCALVHISISQNSPVLTEICPPSCCLQHKTYQSSRTRWSIRAFSCTSKRLHFGALVHISISQNGPVLTEMCSPHIRNSCHSYTSLRSTA